jgi:DNA ligase-1
MSEIGDGDSVEVQGSGSSTYTLKNTGGVYSCTCRAWQFQSLPIEQRTCKHLRAYRGEEAETDRVGTAAAAPHRAAPRAAGSASDGVAPPLLLAHRWENDADIAGWWMSEKLDGVRAFWSGSELVSRQGNRFFAPDWFVDGLPDEPLDGELWLGRKRFQRAVSIVRRQDGSEQWRQIKYLVFDAPSVEQPFEGRLEALKGLVAGVGQPHVQVVDHLRCNGVEHLRQELQRVERLGGEGLMLRQPGSTYQVGRSSTLLKVKRFHDAEARVVAHLPGTGKHKNRLGALRVELPDGTQFSVGTGLSDAEREDPPALGSLITFRYQELSDGGVPRFPSYVAPRVDLAWEQVAWPPAVGGGQVEPSNDAPIADLTDVAPMRVEVEQVSRQLMYEGRVSTRFWEVEQRGNELRISSGRVGREPKVEKQTFRDARAAAQRANKLAEEKLAKGYEEF